MPLEPHLLLGLVPFLNLIILPPALYAILRSVDRSFGLIPEGAFPRVYLTTLYALLLTSAAGCLLAATTYG